MIQDPLVQQFVGQNPRAPAMQAALMAHISEHVGFAYRAKIEQQLGMALPPEDEKLPPEVEVALSGMMAQAARQVLQQSQAQAAQQQSQQQAQDPVFQLQQQDAANKTRELDLKEKKILADASEAADKLELDRDALVAKIAMDDKRVTSQEEIATARMSVDAIRDGIKNQQSRGN